MSSYYANKKNIYVPPAARKEQNVGKAKDAKPDTNQWAWPKTYAEAARALRRLEALERAENTKKPNKKPVYYKKKPQTQPRGPVNWAKEHEDSTRHCDKCGGWGFVNRKDSWTKEEIDKVNNRPLVYELLEYVRSNY